MVIILYFKKYRIKVVIKDPKKRTLNKLLLLRVLIIVIFFQGSCLYRHVSYN